MAVTYTNRSASRSILLFKISWVFGTVAWIFPPAITLAPTSWIPFFSLQIAAKYNLVEACVCHSNLISLPAVTRYSELNPVWAIFFLMYFIMQIKKKILHKKPWTSSGHPWSGQSVYCKCHTVLSCPERRCLTFRPVVAKQPESVRNLVVTLNFP